MAKIDVAVIMGSDSDLSVMNEAAGILKKFGVSHDVRILSAHRSPEDTALFARNARKNGVKIIIAGAGGAAHLAGVVASHTTIPVIGVPMDTKAFKGADSFLSTLQMPGGIPVATMSVGAAGAKNAGILAVEILSLSDNALQKKLEDHKNELKEGVRRKNKELNSKS